MKLQKFLEFYLYFLLFLSQYYYDYHLIYAKQLEKDTVSNEG